LHILTLPSFPTRRSSDLDNRVSLRERPGRMIWLRHSYLEKFQNPNPKHQKNPNFQNMNSKNLNLIVGGSGLDSDSRFLVWRSRKDRKSTRLNSSHEWISY